MSVKGANRDALTESGAKAKYGFVSPGILIPPIDPFVKPSKLVGAASALRWNGQLQMRMSSQNWFPMMTMVADVDIAPSFTNK